MISPKISIIVPCFNLEDRIGKCLDSLLIQTYKNIEIIVIDDGSIDNSKYIIELYASKDCRIKPIFQENKGVGATRNYGIDVSTGDFLMFIDGDDYVANTYVEHFVEASEGKEIIISGMCYEYFDGTKKPIYEKVFNCNYEEYINEYYSLDISNRTIFGPFNKMFSAKLIKDNNIKFKENIKIREDGIFNLEVISKCKYLSGIEYAEYYYIQNTPGSSLISKYNEDEHEINKRFFYQMINIIGEKNLRDKDIEYIFPMYLDMEINSIWKLYNSKEYSTIRGIKYIKSVLYDDTYIYARKKLNEVSSNLAQKYFCPIIKIHIVNNMKRIKSRIKLYFMNNILKFNII